MIQSKTVAIPDHIFKGYDIRGIYPDEFNEQNIVEIVKAIYKFFQKNIQKENFTVVVGRDMRTSSPSLNAVVMDTLIKLGANVIDAGLVSTPTFYFSVFHYKYDCGFQISASHNPKEWNGIKIVVNSPQGLVKIGQGGGLLDIKKMAQAGVEIEEPGDGSVTKLENVLEEEVKTALKTVGNPEIKEFKVVADPGNAMGATYIEELFKQIPGNLIKMNFELDGTFPVHQPDPLQAHTLVDLQKRVVEEKADFGLAPDGDGDRLFFIDEKGEIVPPTSVTSIVTKELLGANKGEKILVDLRYILTPKRIVEELGGKYQMTRVGHAYITEAMHEHGGLFAGESSAHFFFKATGNAEGPLLVILYVLKAMTESGKTLSQLSQEVRRSHESGEINFKVKNAKEIIQKIKEIHQDGAEIIEIDGVAVHYPHWRFSLRPSNTEALLRLNLEWEEAENGEALKKQVLDQIHQYAEFEPEPAGHE